VENGIHFISGLPRAGSTLLAALLRQNPRFHAGMTSPVGTLFSALLRQMSQENETAVFIDDDQRARLLSACFDAFYADIHPEKLAFDTNRMWTIKLPALVELVDGRQTTPSHAGGNSFRSLATQPLVHTPNIDPLIEQGPTQEVCLVPGQKS
jgi:hypothetical protein